VFAEGRSVVHPLAVLYWVDGGAGGASRAAVAVGRRLGNAVQRNRLRRRWREVLRRAAPALRPGVDLVLVARQAGRTAGPSLLESGLRELLSRAGLLAGGGS
jgi:ribonuclease P protein component